MFLLYINDIGNGIDSPLRLVADDSLMYTEISSKDDCQKLQSDLNLIVEWSKLWQMNFNPSKCYFLRITKKRNPIDFTHRMLEKVKKKTLPRG